MSVLIEVRELNKVFHLGKATVNALEDINCDIQRGEYLSIMGPSGSGKSTLFNMIGALDKPSSGWVRVAGVDLTKLTRRQQAYFRGNHIGYIFQAYNLIPAFTALDNVAMPLVFCGQAVDQARRRAGEVLGRVGLGDRVLHRPDELSGGQQQRVAVARALANRPTIILADEPTANLDLNTGKDIIHLLHRLSKEDNVTVISATHDHQMLATSDRIMWIRDGTIERLENRKDIDIQVGTVDGQDVA